MLSGTISRIRHAGLATVAAIALVAGTQLATAPAAYATSGVDNCRSVGAATCMWQNSYASGNQLNYYVSTSYTGWGVATMASGWDNSVSSVFNNTHDLLYVYDNAGAKGIYTTFGTQEYYSNLVFKLFSGGGSWNDRITSVSYYNNPW